MTAELKKIELWSGYEVEVNSTLFDDFDFMTDLSNAVRNNDVALLTSMYFAVVGGEAVYNDAREYIEKQKGYFSLEELSKITKRIDDAFPKAGSRSQRRSWMTSN